MIEHTSHTVLLWLRGILYCCSFSWFLLLFFLAQSAQGFQGFSDVSEHLVCYFLDHQSTPWGLTTEMCSVTPQELDSCMLVTISKYGMNISWNSMASRRDVIVPLCFLANLFRFDVVIDPGSERTLQEYCLVPCLWLSLILLVIPNCEGWKGTEPMIGLDLCMTSVYA